MIRFLAVGLLNTAFGYAVYTMLIMVGALPSVALLLATTAGILFNFQTSRRLVFRSNGRAARFVLVYVAIFALNWTLLQALLHVGTNAILAQGILVLPLAAASFAGQRLFVFRDPARQSGIA